MNDKIYHALSKLSFDVFYIPVASVPSEQIFSKAGDIITKKID